MHAPIELYARPILDAPRSSLDYCYHVMDLPGFGITPGLWDLRGKVPDYLGLTGFNRKRVLEIGPASGFLTAEMEWRGAEVVAVEVTDEHGWDFVPYPEAVLTPKVHHDRRFGLTQLKNTFWITHQARKLKAKVHYGDIYHLPDALGHFDIALLGAVLLHTHSPHMVLAECAKRADTIIVTELYYPHMDKYDPVMRFYPNGENKDTGTWWCFNPAFFETFFDVLGFTKQKINMHSQLHVDAGRIEHALPFFTIVASRG